MLPKCISIKLSDLLMLHSYKNELYKVSIIVFFHIFLNPENKDFIILTHHRSGLILPTKLVTRAYVMVDLHTNALQHQP